MILAPPPPPVVAVAPNAPRLHSRWTVLRPHAGQHGFFNSQHRFNVVPAGRRSGKTEIAKRRLVRRALRGSKYDRPRFFYAAPTYGQVKRIAWEDLKRLVPKEAMRGRPSESELIIPLWHGGEIYLAGMDKPERIEGAPNDGGCVDEYGNMKPKAWGENIRPSLADRAGWCDLIGVPEGRNHYFDTATMAQARLVEGGDASEWGYYHWISADILPAEEIEAARRDLDELTFDQEYKASFVNFEGRAYYAFTDGHKAKLRPLYDPRQPLIVCLDFNVAPGVAAIAQERMLPSGHIGTAVIGEVWIENNSNTPAVCRRVLTDWKDHVGRVEVFGDATGGQRRSSGILGSDWDIVQKDLRSGYSAEGVAGFGDRVAFFVKPDNPAERARINAINSRLKSSDGRIRLMVDPSTAPHVVRDLEGVRTLKGGSGEIDKKHDKRLTHISDALGYYVEHQFPTTSVTWKQSRVVF